MILHTMVYLANFSRRHEARAVRELSFPNMTALPRTVWLWVSRARQRSRLADLDERLLLDIGITRVQAEAEARKWFWMS